MATDEKPHLALAARLRAMGIGKGYAHDLATGRRQPSLALAVRILNETGDQLGPLKGATPKQARALAGLPGVEQAA